MYEIPGGLDWVKANLYVANLNSPLDMIMNYGDSWRRLGYTPVVHIPGKDVPGWNKPWKSVVDDPSGLIDNIPAHIDLFVFDPYNEEEPSGVLPDWGDCGGKDWILWERQNKTVVFNGTEQQFEAKFAHELRDCEEVDIPDTLPYNEDIVAAFSELEITGKIGRKNINLKFKLK